MYNSPTTTLVPGVSVLGVAITNSLNGTPAFTGSPSLYIATAGLVLIAAGFVIIRTLRVRRANAE
jgi:hypothetical protein